MLPDSLSIIIKVNFYTFLLVWAILCFYHFFKFLKPNEGYTLTMILLFMVLLLVTVVSVSFSYTYGDSDICIC